MLRTIRNPKYLLASINDAKSRNYSPYLHSASIYISYINEYFVDQNTSSHVPFIIPEMIWPLLNQEPSISIETALGGHPCIMLSIDDTPHLVAV